MFCSDSIRNGDSKSGSPDKIRVMVVDDSAVIRGIISRTLKDEEDIEIVATASNGRQAIDIVAGKHPDIVILDIEMPVMDGITALPLILEKCPETNVVMCSTLTLRNAEITMKAMNLGASDTIAKPSTTTEVQNGDDFKNTLIRIVRGLGKRKRPPSSLLPSSSTTSDSSPLRMRGNTAEPANTAFENNGIAGTTGTTAATAAVAPLHTASARDDSSSDSSFSLNTNPVTYTGKPEIIAVGSSTGGPQAIFKLMPHFKDFDIPIVLTQHMPATFTKILAQHIEQMSGIKAQEGEEGMPVEPGNVYVAPGGKHMLVVRGGSGGKVISIDDGPQENFCKPSVDPMLRSVIKLYGNKVLMVMLTGMGSDGLKSSRELVEIGGRLVAQDEATSTVWGMPGSVARANLCHAVLPIDEIGPWVSSKVKAF